MIFLNLKLFSSGGRMLRRSVINSQRIVSVGVLLCCGPTYATAEEPRCAAVNLSIAESSMKDAGKALDLAIAALKSPTPKQIDLLEKWMGVRSSSGTAVVLEKLVRTRTFIGGAVFRCANNTNARLGDVYAYVRPDQSFAIVLGHFFFSAPTSGYNSKMGILIHEMTHFTLAGATQDPKIYGPEEALRLARADPNAAQRNAENFEYFVEALMFGL